MAHGNDASRGRRGSRFWLFAPFALLALVVLAWTAGWFVVRERTVAALDDALGVEAALGRAWTCADRRVAGFPFRIEVDCRSLSVVDEAGVSVELGPTRAVSQVYQPRHVILESAGPLVVAAPDGARAVAEWALLEASLRNLGRGDEQVAIVVREPRLAADGPGLLAPLDARADRLDLYARPSPGFAREAGALDLVAKAERLESPGLARLLDLSEPATIEAQLRAKGALAASGEDLAGALESWRVAGGELEIGVVDLATSGARLRLTGALALDAERRLAGRLDAGGRGLGPIAQRLVGGDGLAGAALAAVLGGAGTAGGEPDALTPLPSVVLREGRIFVGPFPLPRVRLEPLY